MGFPAEREQFGIIIPGSKYEAGADYKVEGDLAFTAVWKENYAKY